MSVMVTVALMTRRNVDLKSYSVVGMLSSICCLMSVVWSPVEVTDLITYNSQYQHLSDIIAPIKTSLFLFLCVNLSLLLTFFAVSRLVSLRSPSSAHRRQLCHMIFCPIAILASIILTAIYVYRCVTYPDGGHDTFVIDSAKMRFQLITGLAFSFCLTASVVLVAILLMSGTSSEADRLKGSKKSQFFGPEYLFGQDTEVDSGDFGDKTSLGNFEKADHFKDASAAEENTTDRSIHGSTKSQSSSEGQRLSLLLCVTFCIFMLPVLVAEVTRMSMNQEMFANIHTICLAFCSLQTIVYPVLLARCDRVVRRSVGEMFSCRE